MDLHHSMIDLTGFEPLPKDLRGWNGDRPIFAFLINKTKPQTILEIGSWKGLSTITMAKACREYGIDAKIYAIDTWLGALEFRQNEKLFGNDWDRMLKYGYPQVYYQFLSNLVHEKVAGMVEPVPSTSYDAVNFVPDAELIYVDGDHTYEGVLLDLKTYWSKLKKGGIMFGDDYFLTIPKRKEDNFKPDVKRAVDEFAKENGLELQTVDNNFWVLQK